jgi:copper chaperone
MTTTTLVANVGQQFTVTGMTCGHCAMAVTAELSKLEGVTRVAVDLASGTVITESVETLPIDVVGAAVDEAGYELVR